MILIVYIVDVLLTFHHYCNFFHTMMTVVVQQTFLSRSSSYCIYFVVLFFRIAVYLFSLLFIDPPELQLRQLFIFNFCALENLEPVTLARLVPLAFDRCRLPRLKILKFLLVLLS